MFTYEAVDYSDDPYLQEVARYSVSQEDAAYIVKQRRADWRVRVLCPGNWGFVRWNYRSAVPAEQKAQFAKRTPEPEEDFLSEMLTKTA